MIVKILKSSILKSSLVFSASNAINSSIPFLLIPVLTRYLTTAEYGIVTIFQVAAGLLLSFVGLNTHNAVIVEYYKRDKLDFPNYVYNTLLILLSSVIVVLALAFFLATPLSHLMEFPKNWIPLVVIFAACQFLFQMLLGLWIAEEKPLLYGLFQISQTSLNLSLSLILVIPFGLGWKGRILGQVIVFILYALITLYVLYRKHYIKRGYNKDYVRKALWFGIPLIPHTFGGAALMLSDRLIITHLISIDEVGIYMVGFQFAQIIMLIQDSVNNAFAPWIYKNLGKNSAEGNLTLVKVTYLYFVAIFLFSIVYSLGVPPIFNIVVGNEFLPGVQYIFWISLGFAFNGMYKMVVNYIFYHGKTYILGSITLFCAACNIALTFWLVTLYGTIGAAYSLCVSYLLSFLLTWYFSNKVHPMPWKLKL